MSDRVDVIILYGCQFDNSASDNNAVKVFFFYYKNIWNERRFRELQKKKPKQKATPMN